MKACTGCGETKVLDDFSRNANSKDGRRSRCKACSRAYDTAYAARDLAGRREKMLAAAKRWQVANPEKFRQKVRQWEKANPEKVRQYRAASKERQPEQYRERDRIRQQRHRQNNPEHFRAKSRAMQSRRRARAAVRMSAEDRMLSVSYRKAIAADPCRYCAAPGEQDDHFYPLALGGTDHWWNLVRACAHCNLSKSARCGTWFMLRKAR